MNNINENSFQIEFASAVGMLASRLSLNPTVGQIYGLLYMSPNPVSLNEMVNKLGISKGSASTNVRILESWGAVKKVWVNNSRKDFYEANPDTLSIIFRRLKEGLQKRLIEAKQKLNIVEDVFKDSSKTAHKNKEFYEDRITKTKDMYNKIMTLLDTMSSLNI